MVDSSGNFANLTLSGGLSTIVAGPYGVGGSYDFDGGTMTRLIFSSTTETPESIQVIAQPERRFNKQSTISCQMMDNW